MDTSSGQFWSGFCEGFSVGFSGSFSRTLFVGDRGTAEPELLEDSGALWLAKSGLAAPCRWEDAEAPDDGCEGVRSRISRK